MKLSELKHVIDIMDKLYGDDIPIYWEDGRDGESCLTKIQVDVGRGEDTGMGKGTPYIYFRYA